MNIFFFFFAHTNNNCSFNNCIVMWLAGKDCIDNANVILQPEYLLLFSCTSSMNTHGGQRNHLEDNCTSAS